jgi:ribonuclease R
LVRVDLVRHPIGQEPPLGKISRVLGTSAESATEIDIVSCKHDLRLTFPPEVLAHAEKLLATPTLPDTLTNHRVDLTDVHTIAIKHGDEPIDCAASAFTTPEGTLRAIVHIADAASYVTADDRLDREARKRVSSVYLQDDRVTLLPPAIAAACGFQPGVERLAFSIILDLNGAGELVEFKIQPSRIRLDEAIEREAAGSMVDGSSQNATSETIATIQCLLGQIAPTFREQRHQRGGLDIRLFPKSTPLTDDGRLGALFVDDVTSLWSEVMVMANYVVASHLQALQVPGIYAIQHRPDLVEIEDLIKLAVNLGLTFERDPEAAIGVADLQKLSEQFAVSPVPEVLNYLFKSILKTTTYSSKPGTHFGLAIENGYTHCVAPLCRYADLLVQRVLHSLFEQGKDRKSSRNKESVDLGSSNCHGQITWSVFTPALQQDLEAQISGIISHLNDRSKIAQESENDYIGLQKADRMRARTGDVFQGLITGVQSYGFFVEIEDSLVEGLVHVSSLKDDWYEFRPRYACLVGRKNRVSYRLGDRVEVQVKSVDYYRQQIDLVTVASTLITESAETPPVEAGEERDPQVEFEFLGHDFEDDSE